MTQQVLSPFDESQIEPMISSQGLGETFNPSFVMYVVDLQQQEAELAEATPANSTLLHWSRSTTPAPPQVWWDDETDPFVTDDE